MGNQRGPTKGDSIRQARYNVSRRVKDSMKASRRAPSLLCLPCSFPCLFLGCCAPLRTLAPSVFPRFSPPPIVSALPFPVLSKGLRL